MPVVPILTSGEAKRQPQARRLQSVWTWLFTSWSGLGTDLRHVHCDRHRRRESKLQLQQRIGKAPWENEEEKLGH